MSSQVTVPGHEAIRVAKVIEATMALLNQLSEDRGADITWRAGSVRWVDDGRDDITINLVASGGGTSTTATMTITKGQEVTCE